MNLLAMVPAEMIICGVRTRRQALRLTKSDEFPILFDRRINHHGNQGHEERHKEIAHKDPFIGVRSPRQRGHASRAERCGDVDHAVSVETTSAIRYPPHSGGSADGVLISP
jgi:hypothetical protein